MNTARPILEAGLAAVCPVLDVVALQKEAVRAPGIATHSVALVQRALERPADRAAPAADRERRAMFILDQIDDARVAAQPARGLAGQE
jgi:hypothetical protein